MKIKIQLHKENEACAGAHRKGTKAEAAVWVTDEADFANRQAAEGKCVLFLLHEKNRGQRLEGVRYCLELPAGSLEIWHEHVSEDYLEKIWQRHAGLPWHILDTSRLSLREMTLEDAESLVSMYADEEMEKFMDPLERDRETLLEMMEAYIRTMYGFYEFGMWMVTLRSEDAAEKAEKTAAERENAGNDAETVIGRAGLQLRDGEEYPELGFCIAAPWRRKGYAEEICRAVLTYAFEELEFLKVRVVVHRDNAGSLALCKKLGFDEENQRLSADGLWITMEMAAWNAQDNAEGRLECVG